MASAQAKDAIARLRAAGWKRNQFSVRTNRLYAGIDPTGKPMYEYGDVSITLWNSSKKEQLAKAKAMARQGFRVNLFQFSDGDMAYPHVMAATKPGIWIRKENNVNEHGLHIEERIL